MRHRLTRSLTLALVALCAVLGSGGCAYGEARLRDAADVVLVEGGLMGGVGVEGKALGLVDTGFGFGGAFIPGMFGGCAYGAEWSGQALLGSFVVGSFRARAENLFRLKSSAGWELATCTPFLLPVLFEDSLVRRDAEPGTAAAEGRGGSNPLAHLASPWHAADIEGGVVLLFVGVRVGLSPGALLDFLAGLFTLDPEGDDDRGGRGSG